MTIPANARGLTVIRSAPSALVGRFWHGIDDAHAKVTGVFGAAPSDCFNTFATLVRQTLSAFASSAKLSRRVQSRSNPTIPRSRSKSLWKAGLNWQAAGSSARVVTE